mgnify:CR=1 FL=1
MIKKQFALIFLLWSSFGLNLSCSAQVAQDVKVYDWEVAKNAHPDTIYAISFEKSKLIEVPADLKRYKNVKQLNFAKNKLNDLPEFFTGFESLEVLDLTKNEFRIFPIEICQMKNLKELLVGRNEIASIPECIEYASSIEFLDIYDNPLSHVPESMMRLKKLTKIDFTGIRFNRDFQDKLKAQLPDTKLIFDSPCDCMN